MEVLKTVLTVLLILDSVALIVIILFQEGSQYGLGSLGGQVDTYWAKNKGRSKEGVMVKITTGLVIAFIVLAAVLNMSIF